MSWPSEATWHFRRPARVGIVNRMSIIEVHDVHKRYGEVRGPARRQLRRRPRRGVLPARSQRRRQDDDHRDPRGPPPAERRRGLASSVMTPAAATATCAPGSASSCSPPASRRSSPSASCWRCTAAGIRARSRRRTSSTSSSSTPRRDTKAGELSGGQRRRLDLALGLVGDPDVLFLDEPTTGFDPHARRNAWSTVRTLCETGKTVFLTTHFMDEAQFLADRVAVMANGQIVASGPPAALGGRDELPTEIRFTLPDDVGARRAAARCPAPRSARSATACSSRPPTGIAAAHAITGWALERDVALDALLGLPADARGRLPRP